MMLQPEGLASHLDRMHRAARSMCGSWHEAEDLVQETCARLLARPRVIRNNDELGYLLIALRNTHINRRRSAARRPQLAAMPEFMEIDDHRPGTEERARDAEVLRVVDGLPAGQRQAIVAVDVLELPRPEAARRIGVSETVLADRLKRARVGVAKRLDPERSLAGCP
jgi:RNA polymerase sigma-70 factor, ECF subfamily